MLRLKMVAAILVLAGLLILPGTVEAQPDVCGFYGSVTLDGSAVADGTAVRAWIEGEMAAETTTAGSAYVMKIDATGKNYPGKTIQFTVGSDGAQAQETAVFQKGENINLDLNASTESPPASPPEITLKPEQGSATTTVCGENFRQNSALTVFVNGEAASMVTTDSTGKFCTSVTMPSTESGVYSIVATDVLGRSADQDYTVVDLTGPKGEKGEKGDPGEPGINCWDLNQNGVPDLPDEDRNNDGAVNVLDCIGPKGEKGSSGGSTIAIVALVIAVLALVATLTMVREWRRRYH